VILPVLLIFIIPIEAQQQDENIPIWMKFVFEAWIDDKIEEVEVLNAIKYLVETNIILIENTESIPDQEISLSETEKKLYELEIENKGNTIMTLEKELKDLRLDNALLLQKIIELEQKPTESEMINNLQERNQTLHDKLDKSEERKDVMEEKLLKEKDESEFYYQNEMETMGSQLSKLDVENQSLKRQLDSTQRELELVKAELNKLKQN